METENTFFVEISESVNNVVKWSSSHAVSVSQSNKTSYALIAFL